MTRVASLRYRCEAGLGAMRRPEALTTLFSQKLPKEGRSQHRPHCHIILVVRPYLPIDAGATAVGGVGGGENKRIGASPILEERRGQRLVNQTSTHTAPAVGAPLGIENFLGSPRRPYEAAVLRHSASVAISIVITSLNI